MTKNTAQSASDPSPRRSRRIRLHSFIAVFEKEETQTVPAMNGNGAGHQHVQQAEEATVRLPAMNGNGAGHQHVQRAEEATVRLPAINGNGVTHQAVEAQPLSPAVS